MTSFEERCEREDEEDRLTRLGLTGHDRLTDPSDDRKPEDRWCRLCAKLTAERVR